MQQPSYIHVRCCKKIWNDLELANHKARNSSNILWNRVSWGWYFFWSKISAKDPEKHSQQKKLINKWIIHWRPYRIKQLTFWQVTKALSLVSFLIGNQAFHDGRPLFCFRWALKLVTLFNEEKQLAVVDCGPHTDKPVALTIAMMHVT